MSVISTTAAATTSTLADVARQRFALGEAFRSLDPDRVEAAAKQFPVAERKLELQLRVYESVDCIYMPDGYERHERAGRLQCCRRLLDTWRFHPFATPQLVEAIFNRIKEVEREMQRALEFNGWIPTYYPVLDDWSSVELEVRHLARVLCDERWHAQREVGERTVITPTLRISDQLPYQTSTLYIMTYLLNLMRAPSRTWPYDQPNHFIDPRNRDKRYPTGLSILMTEMEEALWPSDMEKTIHIAQNTPNPVVYTPEKPWLALARSRSPSENRVGYGKWTSLIDRIAEIAHDPVVLRLGSGQINLIFSSIVEMKFLNMNARFRDTGNYKYPLFRDMVKRAVLFSIRLQEQALHQAMQNTLAAVAPLLQQRMHDRREQTREGREEREPAEAAADVGEKRK